MCVLAYSFTKKYFRWEPIHVHNNPFCYILVKFLRCPRSRLNYQLKMRFLWFAFFTVTSCRSLEAKMEEKSTCNSIPHSGWQPRWHTVRSRGGEEQEVKASDTTGGNCACWLLAASARLENSSGRMETQHNHSTQVYTILPDDGNIWMHKYLTELHIISQNGTWPMSTEWWMDKHL